MRLRSASVGIPGPWPLNGLHSGRATSRSPRNTCNSWASARQSRLRSSRGGMNRLGCSTPVVMLTWPIYDPTRSPSAWSSPIAGGPSVEMCSRVDCSMFPPTSTRDRNSGSSCGPSSRVRRFRRSAASQFAPLGTTNNRTPVAKTPVAITNSHDHGSGNRTTAAIAPARVVIMPTAPPAASHWAIRYAVSRRPRRSSHRMKGSLRPDA
ncbi:MAG: hypothetical protein QOF11_799 [Chloroflexota bacterium]|jgi:hypothetical protein|nr:hypothetical protein [Chloroflexota bacterium]